MARTKTEKSVGLYLRLPPDLHEWVKALAEQEDRSLNAQIIVILKEARAQRATSSATQPVDPAS